MSQTRCKRNKDGISKKSWLWLWNKVRNHSGEWVKHGKSNILYHTPLNNKYRGKPSIAACAEWEQTNYYSLSASFLSVGVQVACLSSVFGNQQSGNEQRQIINLPSVQPLGLHRRESQTQRSKKKKKQRSLIEQPAWRDWTTKITFHFSELR